MDELTVTLYMINGRLPPFMYRQEYNYANEILRCGKNNHSKNMLGRVTLKAAQPDRVQKYSSCLY